MSHRNTSSLSIAAVVLLGSVASHAQTASDVAPSASSSPRVTAEPATVTNGNGSTLRGVILRSYAPMQRCATNLPLGSSATTVRVEAHVVIPSAQNAPIQANLQGSTAAPAFETCARSALSSLPWPRVARGATQLRWTYAIELPARQPTQTPPTVTVTADPAVVTNGNASTLRGVILRSYAPMRTCAAQLPRQATPYRLTANVVIPSVADQAITATVRGAESAPAATSCMQTAITQLPWPRLPRDATRVQWTYSIEVR